MAMAAFWLDEAGGRPREAPRELVERAKTETEAFSELYLLYYDRIFGYALRRLHNVAEAEDLTAITFLKMTEALPVFRWMDRPFSAWLYRICINELRKGHAQRQKARIVSLSGETDEQDLARHLVDPAPSPVQKLAWLEQQAALHAAISTLPPNHQDVVTLRYFEGLGIREIARITGSNAGMVKWRLHRSLRKLATCLVDYRKEYSNEK